jgi:hypothetical protein
MNPNREGQVNFELPAQPPTPEQGGQRPEKGQEAPPARPEQAGKQAPAPALPVIPGDIPAADTPVIAIPAPDDIHTPTSDHPAKDIERIEPVWVNKAKEIIAQTHDDPHLRKEEMSRVKAEYIQKRFNKQIKTDQAEA